MLLEIAKEVEVPASQEDCWRLISDIPRLTSCIPGVSDLQETQPQREYSATVTDKVGPFRVQLTAVISILALEPPQRLSADLRGNDGRGLARVQGQLSARLSSTSAGTSLSLEMRLEVLGRLAALGATPMRRRADELFAQFVDRVRAELTG